MIGKTLGRYQISALIGAGGMGEVYRARDERLERDVALKVLSDRALENDTSRKRFRKEAMVLSKLNHPNIATILDFDTQEGLDYLVMELISGTTLYEVLSTTRLDEKEILQLALQIAGALEEAHSFGVVHRDLKPSNIIVTPKGQIKVLDFGLAKLLQPIGSQEITHLSTESNLVIGTVPYMSPEQLRGEPLDERSDIYSFGCVLYEMCTGQRPHTETQPISLVDAILHKIPSPPLEIRPDISPKIQDIILKCLQKDPASRYRSVSELLADLRLIATPSMVTSAVTGSPKRRKLRINWRRISLYAGIPLLILGAVLLAVTLRQPSVNLGPQINSIVALPSRVYGSEENRFLTDAIPNAISTHLSQVEGLETKAPPTSMDIERIGSDLTKIAEFYGVNALVSSSITANANHLILNVQLVDARTRRLLWGRDYDGPKENYLQLVHNAAEGIRTVIRPAGLPIERGTGTQNADAELIYQRGAHLFRSYTNLKQPEDFENALADLQHALKIDPTNARAAATIARLYVAKWESGSPLREVLPEIDRWAYRALELDHRNGDAWQALSIAEEMRPSSNKRKRLEYSLKAATYSSRAGFGHHGLAAALSESSFVLSEHAAREAIKQDPLHLNGLLFTAGILARQSKPVEGLHLIDQALQIQPNMPIAIIMKDWLLLKNHRYQEAEKLFPQLDQMVAERRLHPGWVDFAREWLMMERSVSSNNREQIASALAPVISRARGDAPPFPRWEIITGNFLPIQATYDTPQGTLETLNIRAQKGILEPFDWLLLNPELEAVRKDPQFKQIALRSRAKFEELLQILQEARGRNELPAYLEKPLAQLRTLPAK